MLPDEVILLLLHYGFCCYCNCCVAVVDIILEFVLNQDSIELMQ